MTWWSPDTYQLAGLKAGDPHLNFHDCRDNLDVMLAATYAIKSEMTVDDLADIWTPYLTMAESLRLVAQLFRDDLPTSCCA